MVVIVLVQENMKLNLWFISWLKISFLLCFEGDKNPKILDDWQRETRIAYSLPNNGYGYSTL